MTRDGRRLLEHFSFGKCEQLGGFYRAEDGLKEKARFEGGPSSRYHKDATDKEARTPRSRGRSVVVLYNEMRTHLSLNKDAPVSRAVDRAGHILCRPILGGLHHQYVRI